jgi:hypothetical protein
MHWIRGWVGPRAGMDAVAKRRNFFALPEIEPPPSSSPWSSHYTDWANSSLDVNEKESIPATVPCVGIFHRYIRGAVVVIYEDVSKSFRTDRLEWELQMVQLSATRCSCIAILWVSLVSFAAVTLCVASQRVFIVVVYFVIDWVRKLLDTRLYCTCGLFPQVLIYGLMTFGAITVFTALVQHCDPESHQNMRTPGSYYSKM